MKKFFSIVSFLTLSIGLFAQAPDGLTCDNAIPVDSTYEGTIDAPGTYYFTAGTYDLPLTCYFYPTDEVVDELYLDIDFTCTPGVYDDPNIVELLDATFGWGVRMPIRFEDFTIGVDPQSNRTYYSLSVDAIYRDLMANFGISYDVQAYVKVVTSTAGRITMSPDTAFRSCVENPWLLLSDSVYVTANSGDDVYVLPFSDWQNDSIRFRWMGQELPIQIWLGDDCDYELKLTGDNAALKKYEIYPNAGNDENLFVMSCKDIADLINFADNGGLLYMRAISSEDAYLVVEKQPMQGPMADAIRLDFNQSVPVEENNVQQVYYFPTTWKARDLLFRSTENTSISAYFYSDVELTQLLDIYEFSNSDGTYLGLSAKELNDLCKNINTEFVFVVFEATHATLLIPTKWDVCPCVQTTSRVLLTDTIDVKARTTVSYRFEYDMWKNKDVTIKWNAKNKMKLAIADTCAGFSFAETDSHVLQYKYFENSSKITLDSVIITGEQIRSWANRVNPDGFLYLRYNANVAGSLTISAAPEKIEEPETPIDSTLLNTVELKVGDNLNVALDSVFTIYRINYAEWLATGATLTWTGSEPLHVFVAETYQFAVAPYNKYVHAYVPVPAGGGVVFDKNMLEALKDKVGENGYLYVRLLTEFPGKLTVK